MLCNQTSSRSIFPQPEQAAKQHVVLSQLAIICILGGLYSKHVQSPLAIIVRIIVRNKEIKKDTVHWAGSVAYW